VAALNALEPWMAGQLIYPSVWWEQGAVGLRDPRLAELEEQFSRLD
jgi:putative acetyltransferase